jgi:hypothetical protein
MAKLLVHSFALLTLAAVTAGPALAGKGLTRKQKDEKIKVLEGKINQLQGQRVAAVKSIDAHYGNIIRSLEPKEVQTQLKETLVVLRQLNDGLFLRQDGLDYGGNRVKARASIEQADHQIEKALKHDAAEERAKAAHDVGVVYEDLGAALAFSKEHPLDGQGSAKGELERRAVENEKLMTESLPKIEQAHHLLLAVDHEIKDYSEEKNALRQKRDNEKNKTRQQFNAQIKNLQDEINVLKK